ncbi:MAG: hypothetical protein MRZ90_06430 [Candidatus Gastranaerophilales bacterium]|nr:hypothetical protein [Candidatus Gastranaerophilales bacterium]
MTNSDNLIPFDQRTEEEQRMIARQGGIASGKKRQEKKRLKELLEIALKLDDEETGEINEMAITSALIKQAVKGNVNAYTIIRDTIGEKPTEKQDVDIKAPTINIGRINI